MIIIDGITYHVGITDLQRGEAKEYKYDVATESGKRRRELLARYRTYSVTLGNLNQAEYDALFSAASTNAESVMVTLPDGQQEISFAASVEIGDDAIGFIEDDGTIRWDGLTLEFEGVDPL